MQTLVFDDFAVVVLSNGQWNVENDNIDIEAHLGDGRRFAATLFTIQNLAHLLAKFKESGECASGTFVWAVETIVMRDLSNESIRATVKELVSTGEIETAMLALDCT